ncbi:MAG: hypothetical protein KDD41_12355 [Flavobacteriales bacterium]|nr:hypothetical protein [Flavobacteriales bacterium]
MMINSLLRYGFIFTLLLLVAFVAHLAMLHVLGLPLFANSIVGCYVFNYVIAIAVFVALLLLKDKLSGSLGFLFMGGSMIKFGLFFLIFYPEFHQDQDVSRVEFASFFIPYAISLIVEVYFLSKILGR